MMVKILGSFDLISAFVFFLFVFFNLVPSSLALLVAFYLLIKGLTFLISADIASIFDIISSIIIFLSLTFVVPKFLSILVIFFLIQKGVFSWLS